MDQQQDDLRLNDFIIQIIQTNGFEYAVDNFIALREEYYKAKYQVKQ